MTIYCPEPSKLIEPRIDRVLTQYRESPKLLHMMRVYMGQVAEVIGAICDLPSFFDIDSAVGDQLTLIGKRMGWPRCHCVCNIQPVFGFVCEGTVSNYTLVGFCDDNGTWVDCGPFGTSDICIDDDETYRKFLKARRYQMLALYDIASLTAAVRELFGDTADVLQAGTRKVIIRPGRQLTANEQALLQIYPRVLPVPLGIQLRFHFGLRNVFGFGEGWGGFCEEYLPDGAPIGADSNTPLGVMVGGELFELWTGPLTASADIICGIDVKPYDCAE